jgi:hypothetical protein
VTNRDYEGTARFARRNLGARHRQLLLWSKLHLHASPQALPTEIAMATKLLKILVI